MNSPVISFFSSTSATGTTSTLLSVAMALQENSDLRIGVLLLNVLDEGSDYVEKSYSSLDELKPLLAGKGLDQSEDFLSKFTRVGKQLFILQGNRNRTIERNYHPTDIHYLIERAEQEFDVVLIDGGNHFDNALSTAALERSARINMVITQSPKVVRRFNQLYDQILRPLKVDKDSINFIINCHQDKTYMLPVKHLVQELNIKQYSLIPYFDKAILAEIESKILFEVADTKYQENVISIAKDISKEFALGWIQPESKKGLKSFFSTKS